MLSWMTTAAVGLAVPPMLPGIVDWRWPAVAAVLCLVPWRSHRLRHLAVLLLAFAYSADYCQHRLEQLPPASQAFADMEFDALVLGPVERRGTAAASYYRFAVQLLPGQCAGDYCPPGAPRFRLNYYGESAPQAGQWLRMRMRVKPPQGSVSAGAFDYGRWLMANGYAGRGYVREILAPLPIAPGRRASFQQWRSALLERGRVALDGYAQQGLMRALLFADRRDITSSQWQRFAATGTSHLMAISGMHIGIVLAWGFALARLWVGLGRGGRYSLLMGPLLALLAAIVYGAMAGFSLPTQRALIMALVLCVALLSHRRIGSWQGWQAALLLVLLRDPMVVHSAGFYLSFAAVAALLLIAMDKPRRRWRWLQAVDVQARLLLVLLPVMALWGFSQSPAALPANVLAIPLLALLIMPLLFVGLLCSFVSLEALSAALFGWVDAILTGLLHYLHWLEGLPQWQPVLTPEALWALLLVTLLVLLPRGLPGRPLVALLLLVAVLQAPSGPPADSMWLTVIDVGQGLSVLVQHRDRALLYDVGPDFDGGYNSADGVVLPLLRRRGVHFLDRLVLSHGDRDHAGSAAALLAALPVGEVLSGDVGRHQRYGARDCHRALPWRWGALSLQFLAHGGANARRSNNRSCVLLLRLGDSAVLLPGDIEADGERRLLANWPVPQPLTLLLAAHHGSRSSSSAAMLAAAMPGDVVFSASRFNRYRHPSEVVVQRYGNLGAQCWQTGRHGSLRFEIDGRGIRRRWQAQRGQFFWQARPQEMCAVADSALR